MGGGGDGVGVVCSGGAWRWFFGDGGDSDCAVGVCGGSGGGGGVCRWQFGGGDSGKIESREGLLSWIYRILSVTLAGGM